MVRKKFRGSNVPQLASSHELDQNFIDTNYEEFDGEQRDFVKTSAIAIPTLK